MDQIRITHSAISYLEIDTEVDCFGFEDEALGSGGDDDVVAFVVVGVVGVGVAFAVGRHPFVSVEADSFPWTTKAST